MHSHAEARAVLVAAATAAEADAEARLDLVSAALAMAVLARPEQTPPVLDEARQLVAEKTQQLRGALDAMEEPPVLPAIAAALALARLLGGEAGFTGDTETYDDLANADLPAVVARRKGLPVVLTLIYIAVARGAGLEALSLGLPGHVALALRVRGDICVLDPFQKGTLLTMEDIQALQVAALGQEAPPPDAPLAAMSDLDLLLRVQNNRKLRLMAADDFDGAERALHIMLLLAPGRGMLWRELALLAIQQGRLREAQAHLRHLLGLDMPPGAERDMLRLEAGSLLDQLQRRLN